ncbi:SpoVR family protein [Desulforamulus hydrothermalis]|uniref:Stage V sporulation protein R n=1 Tax=Desulforamulus hydrothermalis Lam5 = DSM 18033 TaxID=1121428 RepID=K8ELX6_9FIRM|nr:SpoVR family protein [Desulforamulus hydrothermalis]CCO09471.1 Stage V sporulation protein R [Desulforamulus hydrothermalis Lam5 = DSM 18033]SHH07506.1 stage V sporulation protein R [Desulforamulus hydrothermalis Lam5 = DSM 18033]
MNDPVTQELQQLAEAIPQMIDIAKQFKLDFYPMRFEICPGEIIYTFGAYGMPTRYTHWSFGKSYHRMKTQYDYNLSRIYEMVINSDPCYAFLLEGNTIIQNKMVAAHVLAHCDFFKNNVYFSHTNPRDIIESMAVAADRFRKYEMIYGQEKVETFVDAVMAVQEHIDPHKIIKDKKKTGHRAVKCCGHNNATPATPYDDLWDLEKPQHACNCRGGCTAKHSKLPEQPEKDLMLFIMENAKDLAEWQRDIISTLRDEMFYFWPQMQTKIMNEGWATYWHLRIMREMELTESEAIEFAKMHAAVVLPSRHRINPYHVGLKIFEDIEKRWDQEGGAGAGREKIFEVRELDNDISFLRNYLTRELVEELDLYLYRKIGHDWKIVEKNWEKVRDHLVSSMTNCGFPVIMVEDGDYGKRGELYLRHAFEDRELDIKYLEKTLVHVYQLWNRPVHLETKIDNKPALFSYDGDKGSRRFL